MALSLPKIIGHRGACGYAPENTIESIRTAADMGVDWVEFDVKLTSDDVPILFHDDTLERVTSGSGLVAETPYSVIKELDAGSWFGDTFINTRIPTLEEAIEAVIDCGFGLNLEIKPCPGRDRETAEIILDHMSRLWDDHDRIIISSFSLISLETAADMLGGDWAIGYLMYEFDENWQEAARHVGAKTLHFHAQGDYVTRAFVESVIDAEFGLLAYTVNEPYRAKELTGWGVDGVFTDFPDIIRDELYVAH